MKLIQVALCAYLLKVSLTSNEGVRRSGFQVKLSFFTWKSDMMFCCYSDGLSTRVKV